MKFDAGSEEMFRQLNHPAAPVYMGEIVAELKELKNTLLQFCFVQGRVTNADPDSVAMWDRETPGNSFSASPSLYIGS